MKRLGFVFLASIFAQQSLAQDVQPSLDIRYKAGNNRQIRSTEIFLPLSQNHNTLYFADIRGMVDGNDNKEGNIGLGVRRMHDDRILGAYAFFDRRKSQYNAYHSQATIGAELLTKDWDIRANAYVPLTDDKTIAGLGGPGGIAFQGNQVVQTLGSSAIEKSMAGFDVEVGYQFLPGLRVFGGGYHFRADDVPDVEGFRGRIQYDVNDYLRLGAEYSQDEVRGENRFAEVRLRIPLGGQDKPKPTGLRKRLAEPVVRDIDIVTFLNRSGGGVSGGTAVPILNPVTNTAQEIWYVDNNVAGGGTGTFDAPFNNLDDALNASDAGDIIYIRYGDGSATGLTTSMASSFNLNHNGMQIIGSGTSLVYNQSTGRITAGGMGTELIAAGSHPVLTSSLQPVFSLNSTNLTLAGLEVNGANSYVMVDGVNDVSGLVVSDMRFINNSSGILLGDYGVVATSDVTFRNITVNNVFNTAINLINFDNVTLNNISIDNTNYNSGINLYYEAVGTSYNFTADDITSRLSSRGFSMSGAGIAGSSINGTIRNLTVSDNYYEGLYISNSGDHAMNINITGLTANNNTDGITLTQATADSPLTLEIDQFEIRNNSDNGILSNNGFNLNLSNGSINNPGGYGIYSDSAIAAATVNLYNTQITGNAYGYFNDYAVAIGPSTLNVGAGSSIVGNSVTNTSFVPY